VRAWWRAGAKTRWRVAGALFVLLVAVAVFSRLTGGPPQPGRDLSPAAAPPAAPTSATAAPSPSPSVLERDVPPGATPDPTLAEAAAAAFTRAWARPPVGDAAWLRGMTPYMTAHLRGLFTGVRQSDMPTRNCIGAPRPAGVTGGAATFHFTCPGVGGEPGQATVTVLVTATGGWRADEVTWVPGGIR
jgi:hypothetical protein